MSENNQISNLSDHLLELGAGSPYEQLTGGTIIVSESSVWSLRDRPPRYSAAEKCRIVKYEIDKGEPEHG